MRATIIAADGRILEFADQVRAGRVAAAENVDQVIRTRHGVIVRVELLPYSDDSLRKPKNSNPQALVHDCETPTNPRGVWEMRRLGSRYPDADEYIRAAYRGT
jgi:hypothetical protein